MSEPRDPAADLAALEQELAAAGDEVLRTRHARMGRGGPRARIDALLDADTFVERQRYLDGGEGVVCGVGRIGAQRVAVYAHDGTVDRGAVTRAGAEKTARLVEQATAAGWPVIALMDSQGARVKEGVPAVLGNPQWTEAVARAKHRVPQVTLACGLCGGAAAYAAVLTDVLVMVDEQSHLFLTGPTVTAQARGQQVDLDELGGPAMHAAYTGAVQAVVDDEAAGIALVRTLIDLRTPAAAKAPATTLGGLVPASLRQGFDVQKVITGLFDDGSVVRFEPDYGRSLVVGFARLAGRGVAFFANQSLHQAGALDVTASHKLARHIRRADRFGLPLVSLVDVPGFLPGLDQEQGGILHAGASVVCAFADAAVPHVSVILRRSVGGGTVLSYSAQHRIGLPSAQVVGMGQPAQDQIKGDATVDGRSPLAQAAQHGYLDVVVDERDLRPALAAALATLDGGH